MAEINKIKVGETTYDVNPSWAIKGNTSLNIADAGQVSSVCIGQSSAYPVNVGIGEAGITTVSGDVTAVFGQSGLSIGTVGYPNARVDIRGNVYVNNEELALGTLNELVNFKDGQNLYIGTQAQGVQIGTGAKSIALGSDGSVRVGLERNGISIGANEINIVKTALDSIYNGVTKINLNAPTIDLPTATKLYFNGIPISKSGNALIFDDQNTELSLDSGWRLTQNKLKVDNIEASHIKLVNNGSGTSLEGLNSLSIETDRNAELKVESGRILAMWSGYGIEIGEHDDGSKSVRIEGEVEFTDGLDNSNLFKNTKELSLPTVNKMYFGHIPVTIVRESGNMEGDTETSVNTQIKISNRRFDKAFLVQTGIQENDITGSIGIGLGTYYGEPYMSCFSEKYGVANQVYVGYEALKIDGKPVLINDFKFDCDKENSKLIISYNGKKAEIQLTDSTSTTTPAP